MNLMGRSSGFIAMQASMASGVVDICLIPEITFTMTKLTKHIEVILERKGHCVVCVAEGAGQVRHFHMLGQRARTCLFKHRTSNAGGSSTRV